MPDDNSPDDNLPDDNSTEPQQAETQPRWQPISAIDRRVAGVLVEKAKTTPDGYPMSLNAIRNACNQKSNRAPMMNLQAEDVEESLQRLRELGAVGMIEGYGRVTKYRHYLYEWLAVDKVELAVMAELLLRGTQSMGDLRARAARMEPIRDLGELRPVVAGLKSKGLVFPLTPEGRGHVVTHALFQPRELEKVRAQYGSPLEQGRPADSPAPVEPARPAAPIDEPATAPSAPSAPATETEFADAFRREMAELRQQVVQLRSDLDDLSIRQTRSDDELRELRDALGA